MRRTAVGQPSRVGPRALGAPGAAKGLWPLEQVIWTGLTVVPALGHWGRCCELGFSFNETTFEVQEVSLDRSRLVCAQSRGSISVCAAW
jgi:hypothetical protein